jgi:hypothetical protein
MGRRVATGEDPPMSNHTTTACTPATAGRRLIGLERHYHCDGCGRDRRSWARMSACPDCGVAYSVAVIRRAAVG